MCIANIAKNPKSRGSSRLIGVLEGNYLDPVAFWVRAEPSDSMEFAVGILFGDNPPG